MEKVVRLAKDVVLKQGYHLPQLVLCGEQGNGAMIIEGFPNEYEKKVKTMFLAGVETKRRCNVGKLSKVFFVLETWMVTLEKGEKITPARQHPRRIETLVISCLDISTKEQMVTSLEYIRDANGTLREIKDHVLPDGATTARAESPLLPAFVAGYNHR